MKDYHLDFPLLTRHYQGQPLVYLDNAATAPKPEVVLAAVDNYYRQHNANVHRGPNFLAEEATTLYEDARRTVAKFINAEVEEIIFNSGTTAGVNLIARSWGEHNLRAGDVIALSRAEHHANFVPWLQLQARLGVVLAFIEIEPDGSFNQASLDKIFAHPRLRLLTLTQASNVLGQYYDLTPLIARARQAGVLTLVDAAQSIAHQAVDVRALGCDFLVFSGHKLFAPTGSGVLFVRQELLADLPPVFGGGGMIDRVTSTNFTPATGPAKFEAGTPNIEGAIGLGAACRYLQAISWPVIKQREDELTAHFLAKLTTLDWIKLLGGEEERLPLFALSFQDLHPHDVADLLGERGFITRAGHHCAQPLHDYFNLSATLRVSLSFYNTTAEIDDFFAALMDIRKLLHS